MSRLELLEAMKAELAASSKVVNKTPRVNKSLKSDVDLKHKHEGMLLLFKT